MSSILSRFVMRSNEAKKTYERQIAHISRLAFEEAIESGVHQIIPTNLKSYGIGNPFYWELHEDGLHYRIFDWNDGGVVDPRKLVKIEKTGQGYVLYMPIESMGKLL